MNNINPYGYMGTTRSLNNFSLSLKLQAGIVISSYVMLMVVNHTLLAQFIYSPESKVPGNVKIYLFMTILALSIIN